MVKIDKRNNSGGGGCGGGIGRFGSGRGRGGWRKFNRSDNRNKRQELKFYPHGNGPDQRTEMFTKVKDRLILNI